MGDGDQSDYDNYIDEYLLTVYHFIDLVHIRVVVVMVVVVMMMVRRRRRSPSERLFLIFSLSYLVTKKSP